MADDVPPEFTQLLDQAASLAAEMDSHFPSLADARRRYFATRSDADSEELDRIQAIAAGSNRRRPPPADTSHAFATSLFPQGSAQFWSA